MDLLAKDRANACLEALIARGVPRANLYATWKGRSEALKVDFIPQVKKSSKFYAAPLKPRLRLPPLMPFRLLHRHAENDAAGGAHARCAPSSPRTRCTSTAPATRIWGGSSRRGTSRTRTRRSRANNGTIEGIAEIMSRYPALYLEVHGEMVRRARPKALADFLQADRTLQVKEIMDQLAYFRASACMQRLIQHGVPEARLFVCVGFGAQTSGHISVDFIPRSLRAYGPIQDDIEKHHPADPATGDRLSLILEGKTNELGEIVEYPLPTGAALYVDERYVLQVPVPDGRGVARRSR